MTKEDEKIQDFLSKFEKLLADTFPNDEDLRFAIFVYQEITDPHLFTNSCMACVRDLCLAFGMSQMGEVHESDKASNPIHVQSQRMH